MNDEYQYHRLEALGSTATAAFTTLSPLSSHGYRVSKPTLTPQPATIDIKGSMVGEKEHDSALLVGLPCPKKPSFEALDLR